MAIDMSVAEETVFLNHMKKLNPELEGLSVEDFQFSDVTSIDETVWKPAKDSGHTYRLADYPDARPMHPWVGEQTGPIYWVARKRIYITNPMVDVQTIADDHIYLYLDGTLLLDTPLKTRYEGTVEVPTGWHDLLAVMYEGPGRMWAILAWDDGGDVTYMDPEWETAYVGASDSFVLSEWLFRTYPSKVTVSLNAAPSDVDDDQLVFTYSRVDVEDLFCKLDAFSETEVIELTYSAEEHAGLIDAANGTSQAALQQYFTDHYNFTIPETGVTVTNINGSTFTVSFDSLVYIGVLTFKPE